MADEQSVTPPRQEPAAVTSGSPANDGAIGPAPAAQVEQTPPPEPSDRTRDDLREIVETLAVVAVMVVLLRAFIAEAFVIPTGSMATTLYGYQELVRCPQCGHEFPVSCSSEHPENQEESRRQYNKVNGCTCPNCFYQINYEGDGIHPSCDSGDRVLVAKYLYDSGARAPERFDVIVFKFPGKPSADYQSVNYIKRLIGKPGETIGIYYGDLYEGTGEHEGESPRSLIDRGGLRIIRKPPVQVLSMRRTVYDNDHPAEDLARAGFPPRWAPESGAQAARPAENASDFLQQRRRAAEKPAWVADDPHGFQHPARQGDLAWLRYRHLIVERSKARPVVPGDVKPQLITDFLGYNSGQTEEVPSANPPPNWVGDLMLECTATIAPVQDQATAGEFVLELSKGIDRFQARWNLSSGECALFRLTEGKEQPLGSAATALRSGSTHRVRFASRARFSRSARTRSARVAGRWTSGRVLTRARIAWAASSVHTSSCTSGCSLGAHCASVAIASSALRRSASP